MRRSGTLLIGLVTVALAVLTVLLAVPLTVVSGYLPSSFTGHKLVWIAALALSVAAAAGMTWWLWYQQSDRNRRPPGSEDDRPAVIVGEIPLEPPGFVDRASISHLAEAVESGRAAVVCAIVGMRGVGKTQVAAAYARARSREGWTLVGWVNAESQTTLQAGLARIANAIGVADPDGDSAESARRLRDELESRTSPSLLVFDNATDPDELRSFVPASGCTQLVVTSTDRAFVEWGTLVDVSAFSREESVAYLAERTSLEDESGSYSVARELGDLPLALAQAASTIDRRRWSYSEYLTELERVPVEQLLGRVAGGDYPRSTAAALLLSVESVEDADPSGLTTRLLRVIALLSAEGVRRHLLHGLAGSGAAAKSSIDVALERCAAGSLLAWSVAGDAVIMHRLLGRVLRERDQVAGSWQQTVELALNVLESVLVPEEQAWPRRAEGSDLAIQVEALWNQCSSAEHSSPTQADRLLHLRSWSVGQLRRAADLSSAIKIGTEVLADCLRILGPDHLETLTARNDLGVALRAAGQLDEATPILEQNLADRQRVLGPDHPQTLVSQNSLAFAYRDAGRLADSIDLFEQTLIDRERVLGPDHPETLSSRNDLADAYREAGRLDRAVVLLEQTLTDRLLRLETDHPQILTSRNDLAFAYREAGQLDQAIQLYEQNLAERQRILGSDHPATLMSRNNLAFAYRKAGRLEQAVQLYEQNLAERRKVLGPDHPATLKSQNNLGMAYLDAGRFEEAITLLSRNLSDREKVLGLDHPRTLTSRRNLGIAFVSVGRFREAVVNLHQNLIDSVRILGPDHPLTLKSRNGLALAHREAGQIDEAIKLYDQNLAETLRVLGPEHPQTLNSRNELAIARLQACQPTATDQSGRSQDSES